MRAASGRYRLVHWDEVEPTDRRVSPGVADSWIRSWLSDPALRREVFEVFSTIGGSAERNRGWFDDRSLHAFVRPAIDRAILGGRLVVVERYRPAFTPPMRRPLDMPPPAPIVTPIAPVSTPAPAPAPAPEESPIDARAQAEVLKLAAENGTPFCEECEKLAKAS